MAEPALISIPWLDDFERDPAEAVDDLLRGVADVSPYERAGAADVLVTLFGGHAEKDGGRLALDEALGDWLLARHGDGPLVRREHGMNRYVEELIQAFTAVHRLRLVGTADRLRAGFVSFQRWLRSLALGPGQDPALELWRVMAVMQPDRRFLGDWYRLCEEAGRSLTESYLTVGLLGLRRLPSSEGGEVDPGGRLGPEVVAGLFRWAARLPQGPASRKAFQRHLGALKVLYPRAPQRWRDLMLPLIDAHPGAPFLDWLEGTGIKLGRWGKRPSGIVPALPPRSLLEDLLRRLRNEPADRLIPEIRALVRGYERYAGATGDAEFLVKTATHFSGRLRRWAPREALILARLANRWEPSNPYTWTQWAAALEALGADERAEAVYWEAVRRFPEDERKDEVARVALADLLARKGRSDEAEALLRETIVRFPDNPVVRNALADLLARTGRSDEAESLLREIVDRFPEDEVARNALGDLLTQTNRRIEEDHAAEKPREYPEGSAVPGIVAEPRAVYKASEAEVPPIELDLDPRLLSSAEVSRADLSLRSGENGTGRWEALGRVERVLETDPDYVYPRLILGLHETIWRQRLVDEVEVFPHAYPLRFLAARETGSASRWDRLLSDFGEHYPWTLLGRLVDGNGDADPADAARLAAWVAGGNGSRQGFEAFTAKRLKRWLGDSASDTEPTELLRRLTAHRLEIETLVGDALRRAADEGS